MKKKHFLFVLILITGIAWSAFADSPLTSTEFYAAYKNEKAVILASETEGLLIESLFELLVSDQTAIDEKIAAINALGWSIEGKSNSVIFFNYLQRKKGYADKADFAKRGRDYEFLCFAYLKALDDYFDVDEAIIYAEKAVSLKPESYTFNIICALIKSQKAMDSDWCLVYQLTNKVRENQNLVQDMKDEAKSLIFDYMDLYKDECE